MASGPADGTKRRTMSVEEAGRQLGLSRNSAYQAAGRGEIPTIKIGRRLLVPIVALERLIDPSASIPQGDA
ncbi:helix-turn-helix domain-containing protein [Methylobacterium sp. J-090]|uniref:helix-turn-helix domain-containing protein n=1 Tax=Methylobacterium sp. J-090 TaxID=2836666 RepID=UPI001FB89423|nr:helix-turn-helix domain-containing protein [Methylobacterium sp. J-090]MCJ2082771.1 helix-turn-helix domain-containing protein [Methylobacterium sp. J-090]